MLIVVTTYPQPSRSYDELVCTAGLLEDGSWIRIYPVPFKFLGFNKFQWIELDLVPRERGQDFRPESFAPRNHDLRDLKKLSRLDTSQAWRLRKEACLKRVYTSMALLIAESHEPRNHSLAAFKPAKIRRFLVEAVDREWKPQWLEQLKQIDMFTSDRDGPRSSARVPIEKIPYKFKYHFEDERGRQSTMSIEDWEIGALYKNCLKRANGDETQALKKVRERYETDFINNKDIFFFMGTTLNNHLKRRSNPFTIVGIFYPPKSKQSEMF